ncbi:hypothetical protein DXG03_001868, partial [Asterophora parasitica]
LTTPLIRMLIDKKYLEVREKVLSDAGVRNELLLSRHELESSKALLDDYEAALVELDREIAPLFLRRARPEERLDTFRVAVAPHKRIPVELLSKIFAGCESDPLYSGNRRIPLNTRYPWVLGQVCSLWRSVSRNDPGLWRNIIMKATPSSERLCEILPAVASKTLAIIGTAEGIDHIVTLASTLIPQVHTLEVELYPTSFKSMFDRLPANILGHLENLHISLSPETSANPPLPVVLTEAFSSIKSLRSLTLECDDGTVPQALALVFPWHQILSLDISDVEDVDVVAISKYIQGFKSLESLSIYLTDHRADFTAIADTQLILQAFGGLPQTLRSLCIQGNFAYPSSNSTNLVLESVQLEAWGRLVSLDLITADIPDGATIKGLLRQCVQLV